MTTDSTNRMNSFIHQFDLIEESLMDFVLETVLRLGALTETRLFLIVEGTFYRSARKPLTNLDRSIEYLP